MAPQTATAKATEAFEDTKPSPKQTGAVVDINTRKPLKTNKPIESDALVDGKIISADEARKHFESTADASGYKGQQRSQIIEQYLVQAQNRAEEKLSNSTEKSSNLGISQQQQDSISPTKDFLYQVKRGADNGGADIWSSALYMAKPLPKEAYAPYPRFNKK